MVPLSEYPMVDASATVLEAVIRLDECRQKMEPGRQPFQAVLVADRDGRIVGKLGQLALLRAMEPRSQVARDWHTLRQAGVSDSMVEQAMDNLRMLKRPLDDLFHAAASLPVNTVMHAVYEHIDISTPIGDIIHHLVEWQTLSIIVTENDRPVGLVRLAEVFDELFRHTREMRDITED
jgi:hypothetical protein